MWVLKIGKDTAGSDDRHLKQCACLEVIKNQGDDHRECLRFIDELEVSEALEHPHRPKRNVPGLEQPGFGQRTAKYWDEESERWMTGMCVDSQLLKV